MKEASRELITGMLMGVLISLMLALVAFICIKWRCRYLLLLEDNPRRASTIPIRTNGVDASVILSDSTVGQESPVVPRANCTSVWLDGTCKKNPASLLPGIPKYTYRDLQKATCEFTSVIGQGAFGPVFKATVSTRETVAVKVLDTNSKQGEQEFQTEVLLLGRLHHRNLVNLLGYCADKGQLMLVYMYMTNGSLASHLYCEEHNPLSWTLRVDIALDVARGLEYLHYGAVPPVVHCDIKPSNVLLDQSMRARVADFGLSREIVNHQKSNVKGTFGYLDPEYISSKIFTEKSDVYSFGVLLLEMIAGRSPQQGLMDYVELAAMDVEGSAGWEEIVDPRLSGAYNAEELHNIAVVAHKCINPDSGPRPSMRFVVQALSQVVKARDGTRHQEKALLPVATAGEEEAN